MSTVIACANESCSEGAETVYNYNPVGSLQSVEHANATATEYQYDELNRLTLLRTWDAQGTLIQRQQFHLGAAGHREMVVEVPERVVEYTYDALYRLTEEKVTDPNGDRTTTYTFDATGNRLSRAVSCDPACTGEVEAGTTTYVYDANDRLLEESGPDGTTIYTYDENGNTTRKTAPDGIVDYHYNTDDRLTRATGDLESAATEASYTYDAHGIRQGQVVDGVEGRFLVDPTHQYAQVLEELDGAGNPVALYVVGHERISQTRAEGQFTYHGDGLGSIRHLTNEDGLATDRFVYEAYGLLEHREGTSPNNFRYTGEQYDPNLGFYYLRARYYNPATGRFPTMDTYQGRIHEPQTLHKYLYVHADPVNGTDPTGLFMNTTGLMVAQQGRTTLALQRLFSLAARPLIRRAAVASAFAMVGTAAFISSRRLEDDPKYPPMFLVGNNHPEVRAHIKDALLKKGISSVVHRKGDEHDRGWLRTSLVAGTCGKGLTGVGTGKDCDEFPMATHIEGGKKNFLRGAVSVRAVSASQNRSVGGMIPAFHDTCGIVPDDPGLDGAYVMGITDAATHWICGAAGR